MPVADDRAESVQLSFDGNLAVVNQRLALRNGERHAFRDVQRHIRRDGRVFGQAGVADDLAILAVEQHAVLDAVWNVAERFGTSGFDPGTGNVDAIAGVNTVATICGIGVNHAARQGNRSAAGVNRDILRRSSGQ